MSCLTVLYLVVERDQAKHDREKLRESFMTLTIVLKARLIKSAPINRSVNFLTYNPVDFEAVHPRANAVPELQKQCSTVLQK